MAKENMNCRELLYTHTARVRSDIQAGGSMESGYISTPMCWLRGSTILIRKPTDREDYDWLGYGEYYWKDEWLENIQPIPDQIEDVEE